MAERLYHKEIGFPPGFVKPIDRIEIDYGTHARKEALADRYGEIRLPKTLRLSRMDVVEIGMVGDSVSKILFRGRLDERRDLCIVLIPERWFCKTVWVNLRTDRHGTLDRTKYERA